MYERWLRSFINNVQMTQRVAWAHRFTSSLHSTRMTEGNRRDKNAQKRSWNSHKQAKDFMLPSSIGYLCNLHYILKLSCSVSYRWYPTTFHFLRKEQCHFTSPLTLPFTYFPLSSFKPSVLLFLPGQDW